MLQCRMELMAHWADEPERHAWFGYYRNAKGDLREKAEAATRATTEWYHLLYYAGKQGTLQRVDTSPKSELGVK